MGSVFCEVLAGICSLSHCNSTTPSLDDGLFVGIRGQEVFPLLEYSSGNYEKWPVAEHRHIHRPPVRRSILLELSSIQK